MHPVRSLRAVFMTAALLALLCAMTGTASAARSYNDVDLTIRGGDATALSACVNLAKASVKANKVRQNNFCKNFAKANGGDVELESVSILVSQTPSSHGTSSNDADITIRGGDATAVAACVNVLQGTASASQKNVCKNTSVANGGNVELENVDITILQG